MMEKINIKILAIVLIVIILIGVGAFTIFKLTSTDKDKNYELELIEEANCKYFTVVSDGKYGVIDTSGKLIIENIYSNVIVPNPTKAVFIATKEDGSNVVLNENAEEILNEYNNVSAIRLNEILTNFPYEKSVLKYEENRKIWFNRFFR